MKIKRISLVSTIKISLIMGAMVGASLDVYYAILHYTIAVPALNECAKQFNNVFTNAWTITSPKICGGRCDVTQNIKSEFKLDGIIYEGIFGEWELPTNTFFLLTPVIVMSMFLLYGFVLTVTYNIAARLLGGIRIDTSD